MFGRGVDCGLRRERSSSCPSQADWVALHADRRRIEVPQHPRFP
jgi:hypothetical protein